MKCKICPHRTNTIQAMAAHYRKAHPNHRKKEYKQGVVKEITQEELEQVIIDNAPLVAEAIKKAVDESPVHKKGMAYYGKTKTLGEELDNIRTRAMQGRISDKEAQAQMKKLIDADFKQKFGRERYSRK